MCCFLDKTTTGVRFWCRTQECRITQGVDELKDFLKSADWAENAEVTKTHEEHLNNQRTYQKNEIGADEVSGCSWY